ncbi:DUF4097 family beta strand repeat-containing protein [Listeria booriae]|uniref:DUF4097 domain-containing protein n=1 Tax=Listeria booriae TaxID=1552123 RepID=A0A7X1DLH4_9LIST|nr:DUF4097 family beta strand repeat-containing protein [Listeria booriae]MBC2305344.1 DUF4097 domain-containing protein [Listeria booriae]MBC2311890.1 DUF4097 domain-containing protein [Listeria booriae]
MFKNKKKLLIIGVILLVIGGIGMAFTFNSTNVVDRGTAYSREWKLADGDISQIKVSGDEDLQVTFAESTTGKNYVTMSGNLDKDTIKRLDDSVKENQDSLTINVDNKQEWMSFLDFKIYGEQQVTIYLTKDAKLAQLESNLNSSDLMVQGAVADNVTLTSGSGSIEAADVKAKSIKAKNNSGDIELRSIAGNVDVTNSSGESDVLGMKGDNLNVSSNSGDIEVKQAKINTATLKNSSGSIDGEQIEGVVKAENNSGDVDLSDLSDETTVTNSSGETDLSFLDVKANVAVNADSGDVSIEIPSTFDGFLDLRSNSGDIKAPNSKPSSERVIKVRTSSGNIKVEQ